jgi:murein DD-endopeptidase MepM/ murein hydrolase activator NlpD
METLKSAENKLRNLQTKLKNIRKEKKILKSKELDILTTLQNIDEELDLTNQILKQMEKKRQILSDNIDSLNIKIGRTDSLIIGHQIILMKRLRYIYKFGNISIFDILFSSYTFTDAINRLRYLTLIAKLDKRVYEEFKLLKSDLNKYKSDIERSIDQLNQLEKQTANELIEVEKEKTEKKKLLRTIRRKRSRQKKLESELLSSRRKLQRIIQKLETQRKKQKVKEKSYFGKLRKKLPWPIIGKVVSKYGRKRHPKYHTSTKNNGIDIKAPYNTPVAAVSYGEVAYADKFLGYGNVILIDHYGGYYTLYAHLSSMDVQVKDKVYQGEVIGRVGDTGSLKGSVLHFEIRVNGKTVDPLNWLINK